MTADPETPTESAELGRRTPPYITWGTFVGLLDRMKAGVPTVIDASVLTHVPGGARRQIKSAFRFLGLIDDKDHTTPMLGVLIAARRDGGETWKAAVADHLTKPYAAVVDTLNLQSATAAQLNEAFKSAGMQAGEVREKAIRFYLSMLKEGGVSYSHYFEQRGAKTFASRGANGGKRVRKASGSAGSPMREVEPDDEDDDEIVPEGFIAHPFRLRADLDITLTLPADLTKNDVERIYRFMQTLPLD